MGGSGGVAECRQSIAAAAVPTWILIVIVIVIVLVLTAIIVRSIGNNRPTVTAVGPAPTVATQIEDLSRLKEQGLISPEEFDAKRSELLARL